MKTLKESILGSMGMGDNIVKYEMLFNDTVKYINDIKNLLEKTFGGTWSVEKEIYGKNRSNLSQVVFTFTTSKEVELEPDNKCQKIYDKIYDMFQSSLKKDHWNGTPSKGSVKKKKQATLDITSPTRAYYHFGFYSDLILGDRFSFSVLFSPDGDTMAEKIFEEF